METAANSCRAMVGYGLRLMDDLSDADFATRAGAGAHAPAWIVGHLCVIADLAVRLAGGTPSLPAEWRERFGLKSVDDQRPGGPTRAELVERFRERHDAAVAALLAASAERRAAPQQSEFFRTELPTVGDFLAHLLTSHLSLHLGQLSLCRRLLGRPPLF